MRRALDIDERSYGEDHPSRGQLRQRPGALLKATDRLAEAEPLMPAGARDRRATATGSTIPRSPDAPQQPGLLLQATRRLAEAEPLMRRALDIDERSFGLDHPDVAASSTTWPGCFRTPTGSPRPSRFHAPGARNRRAQLRARPLQLPPSRTTWAVAFTTPSARRGRTAHATRPGDRRHIQPRLGYPHPQLWAARNEYAQVLQARGRDQKEIMSALSKIGARIF